MDIHGSRPYVPRGPFTSADGAQVQVCTFSLTTTSCQAHADYRNKRCGNEPDPSDGDKDLRAAGGNDALCGADGVDDGYCVWTDDFDQYLCTVPCNNNVADCPEVSPHCDDTPSPDLCTFP